MKKPYVSPETVYVPAQCKGLICSSIQDLTTVSDWPAIFENE